MPQRYVDAILKYLSDRAYQPLKPRQLARQMGVGEEHYDAFREAIKVLRDAGRIVLGAKNALTLPEISSRLVGFYRPNPRGFGFIIPETPNAHGDLFVPIGSAGGALNGDLVVARVIQQGRREGKNMYAGQIVEIVRRGNNRFVGTLKRVQGAWFVLPDGKQMATPIVVRDIGAAGPPEGSKVVVEIVQYAQDGELPAGVVVETLGEQGQLDVETQAMIRSHGLDDEFTAGSADDARTAIEGFDENDASGREDLTAETIITIDPPDARDFDDAIGLVEHSDGTSELGVHIADVSHFVPEGCELDRQAKERSTSVYFPKRVVPMLPEVLSNGVCSLQEGQRRYCKSAFIRYDAQGRRIGTRFAETVIASAKRLNYVEAQGICDGATGGYEPRVAELIRRMEKLARRIEARRSKAGMIHLDLPEVQLVFDADNKVVDAVPQEQSYTHTIIEMFMVEANEAVAELLDRINRPCLRRIHPAPDEFGAKKLGAFVHAAGHKIPANLTRHDIQALLAAVRGRPESYAVNLAVLKTFEQAEYSPMQIGHFALGSEHYCHFTSPIRRYPDLTVHRLLAEYCRGTIKHRPPEDLSALTKLGEHCSSAERRAQAAEDELRDVLVLQLLAGKVGEDFDGVITGVTNFGIFVQSPRFLIEGLIRLEHLGDDWWEVDPRLGQVRGEMSGRVFRIGDLLPVRIASVDVARRQLNLALARSFKAEPKQKLKKPQPAKRGARRPQGQAPAQASSKQPPRHGRRHKKNGRRKA